MLNKKTIILIIIIVLAVGAGTLWYVNRNAKELARRDNNKEKIEKREKEVKKQDVVARNNNEQESDGQEAEKTAVEAGDMSTSTDEIDTSDWQTYRNEEYGFEVKYQPYWKELPSGTDVEAIDLKFFIDNTTKQVKLSPLLNFSISKGGFIDALNKYDSENHIINGLNYKIYNYKDDYSGFGHFTDIMLKKDGFYFFIGINQMEDNNDALNRLREILSSFKFLD